MKKQTTLLPTKLELQTDHENDAKVVTPIDAKAKTYAPYVPQYLTSDTYHSTPLRDDYNKQVITNEPSTGFTLSMDENSKTISDIVKKEQMENQLSPYTLHDPRGFTLKLTNQNIQLLVMNNPLVFNSFETREFCYAFALGREKNLFLVETNSPAYEDAYDQSQMREQKISLKPKEIEKHASRNGVILTNKRGERSLYLGKVKVGEADDGETRHLTETKNVTTFPITSLSIKTTTTIPSYTSVEVLPTSEIRDAVMERLRDLTPLNPMIATLPQAERKKPLTFDTLKGTWLAPLYNQTLVTAPRWFGSIRDTNREIPSPITVNMEREAIKYKDSYKDSYLFGTRPLWFYDEAGTLHVGQFRLNTKKLDLDEIDMLRLKDRISRIYDNFRSGLYHQREPHMIYSHHLLTTRNVARHRFIESKKNGDDKNEERRTYYERNRDNLNEINKLIGDLFNVDTLPALEIESVPYYAVKQGLVKPPYIDTDFVTDTMHIISVTDIGTNEKIYPVDVKRANGDIAVRPLKGDFYFV